jgi:hypothetical protein
VVTDLGKNKLLLMEMVMSMGWDYVSELRPPTGLLFAPIWYVSIENHGGMILPGKYRRTLRETCPRKWILKSKAGPLPTCRRQGERRYSSYSLTSALDEVSGQRHARPRFAPGERTPGTHCKLGGPKSWSGHRG